jgi:hypothetical protein
MRQTRQTDFWNYVIFEISKGKWPTTYATDTLCARSRCAGMGVAYILLSRTYVRLRLADNEASPKETIGRMLDGKITMARSSRQGANSMARLRWQDQRWQDIERSPDPKGRRSYTGMSYFLLGWVLFYWNEFSFTRTTNLLLGWVLFSKENSSLVKDYSSQ